MPGNIDFTIKNAHPIPSGGRLPKLLSSRLPIVGSRGVITRTAVLNGHSGRGSAIGRGGRVGLAFGHKTTAEAGRKNQRTAKGETDSEQAFHHHVLQG